MTIPPVMEVSLLGVLPDTPDFKAAGESLGVWRTPNFPGYLFKRYNAEAVKKISAATLDRLVQQPLGLPDPAEAAFLATSTSWPVSRITEHQRTVGVMMPEAPPGMSVSWLRKSFSNPVTEHSPLPIDYLAKDDDWLAVRGIPRQSAADRDALCRSLVRVACFFEQCDIVYADWSYANAFWQPYQQTVYIFDLDGASYGPRSHVFTSEFEDPLTPQGDQVDTYTDRYRVALLVGRILTKSRSQPEVKVALSRMSGPVPRTLLGMLIGAGDRTTRPSLTDLAQAFGVPVPQVKAVDPTGVHGWRTRTGSAPAPAPKIETPAATPPNGWRPRPGFRASQPAKPPPVNGNGGRAVPSQPGHRNPATGSYPVIPRTPPPQPPPTQPPPAPPPPVRTPGAAHAPAAKDPDWSVFVFGLILVAAIAVALFLGEQLLF